MFHVCALNRAGKMVSNRAVKRAALPETVAQLQPCRIAMESCAGAHHWGRTFQKLGHEVVLVPPQHVKPFVRGGKSDPRDALAKAAGHVLLFKGEDFTHTDLVAAAG